MSLPKRIPFWTFADSGERDTYNANEGVLVGDLAYTRDIDAWSVWDGVLWQPSVPGTPRGYFDPLAKPLVTASESQEFAGGDISGMTAWNPGSNIDLSAWNGFLRVRSERQSVVELGGAYCPIPSGSWCLTTCLRALPEQALSASGYTVGLAVFATTVDSSPTTARAWTIELYQPGNLSSNTSLRVYGYIDYLAGSVSGDIDLTARFTMTSQIFVRIRYNPTTPRISFDFSHDGLTWYVAFTATSGFYLTPAYAGLIVNNATTLGEFVNGLCPFLRFSDDDSSAQLSGRVV